MLYIEVFVCVQLVSEICGGSVVCGCKGGGGVDGNYRDGVSGFVGDSGGVDDGDDGGGFGDGDGCGGEGQWLYGLFLFFGLFCN